MNSKVVGQLIAMERKDRYILTGLVLIGLIVRFFMWWWTQAAYLGDMIYYVDVAKNLGSGRVMEAVEPLAPPLYPLLIQTGYLILQDYEISARLISVIFGGLLVYPVFRLAHLIYGKSVAILAGLLTVFAGELVNYSLQGYAESIYLFFITMAIYKGVKTLRLRSDRELFWTGLFFGIAFLTKGQAIAFFTFTFLWMVGTYLIQERKISIRIISGILLLGIGYGVAAAPYYYLLHEKMGEWILNPKANVLSSTTFLYRSGETHEVMYALRRGQNGYYTYADVVYGGKVLDRKDREMVAGHRNLSEKLPGYLSELRSRFTMGLPDVAQRLFPFFFIFFVTGLLKKAWDLRSEGYLLSIMGVNIFSASLYGYNPRYLNTLMPIILLIGAHGTIRCGSFLGKQTSRIPLSKVTAFWRVDEKRWMILLSGILLAGGLVQLLHKQPDNVYIARVKHQKQVAEQLRERFGTGVRVMSWGLGRSAIPYYMGMKQSQVRTIPLASMERVVDYARQEGVRLLVFDTEEINPARFPGIVELLNHRGVWPGLEPILVSPRGRQAVFVFRVI